MNLTGAHRLTSKFVGGECVACEDLSGLVDSDDPCVCLPGAHVDEFGVCSCMESFCETDALSCVPKSSLFGIGINATHSGMCGVNAKATAAGECVCRDGFTETIEGN